MNTLPTEAVARRLAANLAEIDRLIALLTQVADGQVLTNRLDEALVIVPETVMAEIRRTIGADQAPTSRESR